MLIRTGQSSSNYLSFNVPFTIHIDKANCTVSLNGTTTDTKTSGSNYGYYLLTLVSYTSSNIQLSLIIRAGGSSTNYNTYTYTININIDDKTGTISIDGNGAFSNQAKFYGYYLLRLSSFIIA